MKEKLKVKDPQRSMFKAINALKFSAMLCLVLAFAWQDISAQARHTVTGTVTSATDNTAIPGASIQIKGTSMGTITDMDGKFTIEAAETDVLVVSFIGYKTMEVTVGTQTNIDIRIQEDIASLDEVVVIGYGVQKRKLNTGATLNIKGEQLQSLSTTNAFQALQGQTPGVNITATSGQPGEGFKVVVRGVGTISNSSPLYIVDGVKTGDITYLSTADIESIDVLKDAASAAIYGSEGANGVVLVTTRQGRSGKAQLTLDGYYGVQNVYNKARMLNAREYAIIMNEQAVNSGKLPVFTDAQINSWNGKGTNWMDEMFVSNAPTQSYTLGLTGGSERSTYSSALTYTSQAGVVGGASWSDYERFNFRFNSEHKIYKDVLNFGENLTFSYVDRNGIAVGGQYSNTLRGAFNTNPFIPMYDSTGNFFNNSNSAWTGGSQSNPYADMVYNNINKTNNQRMVASAWLELIPIRNLSIRSTYGIDYSAGRYHSYRPVYRLSIYNFNDNSRVTQTMFNNLNWIWDNVATYNLNVNQHQFTAMAGISASKYGGANINASNANLSFTELRFAYLGNTTYRNGPLMTVGGAPYDNRMYSYFGRLSYNFRETYLFNGTFRADASSRFASGHRWGYFPSVSAGWVISNESFLQNAKGKLDFLKIRASWGQNGNQNIADHNYEGTIATSLTNYIFGNTEGQLTPGAYPDRLGNVNLKWETSEQLDLGFDAVTLNNKFYITFDWYKKTTKDWLIVAPILATAGANPPYINGGNVENKGVELAFTWNNNIGALNYSVGANLAYNKNNVTQIPTSDQTVHGGTNELWNNAPEFNRAQAGYPIGYFWGYKTLGVFQTEAEVNAYKYQDGTLIQPNAKPGDLKYFDANGKGGITLEDKIMIGDPNPDYTLGLNISMNYKRFDFSVLANGVLGNQVVQSYRNQADQYANYFITILDRWHGEGSSNKIPRLTDDARNFTEFSDIYIQNGDFLRISNITFGYDFAKLFRLSSISQARLYVTAQNLFTFTKYTGMDPELGYGNNSYSYGIDFGYYPHPTTILFGFNIKF